MQLCQKCNNFRYHSEDGCLAGLTPSQDKAECCFFSDNKKEEKYWKKRIELTKWVCGGGFNSRY